MGSGKKCKILHTHKKDSKQLEKSFIKLQM